MGGWRARAGAGRPPREARATQHHLPPGPAAAPRHPGPRLRAAAAAVVAAAAGTGVMAGAGPGCSAALRCCPPCRAPPCPHPHAHGQAPAGRCRCCSSSRGCRCPARSSPARPRPPPSRRGRPGGWAPGCQVGVSCCRCLRCRCPVVCCPLQHNAVRERVGVHAPTHTRSLTWRMHGPGQCTRACLSLQCSAHTCTKKTTRSSSSSSSSSSTAHPALAVQGAADVNMPSTLWGCARARPRSLSSPWAALVLLLVLELRPGSGRPAGAGLLHRDCSAEAPSAPPPPPLRGTKLRSGAEPRVSVRSGQVRAVRRSRAAQQCKACPVERGRAACGAARGVWVG